MDFLESAAILIPAATGMALTIYDGNADILTQFEQQYCFSPKFQPIYTVTGIMALFENGTDQLIYELIDPLGSYLIAAKVERGWIILRIPVCPWLTGRLSFLHSPSCQDMGLLLRNRPDYRPRD